MSWQEKTAGEMNGQGIPDIAMMQGYRSVRSILLVGCGGTGAYVAGHLARLVSVMNQEREKIAFVLSDGDKVEKKNLERQHFVGCDLGRNKAEVLADRYSSAFGMEIKAIVSYLETAKDIEATGADMVIGCVDNNASRRVVNDWFLDNDSWGGRFWIDAGNEEESGQVVCGYRPPKDRYYVSYDSIFSLPTVAEIYPGILEGGRFNSQLSCAELAASSPQNMMANITAAALVLNFAQKIVRNKPLGTHGVMFSVDNSFSTVPNTPGNLSKVDGKRRRAWEAIVRHVQTL
jgi:PRTRC genetic system ThiF family protein